MSSSISLQKQPQKPLKRSSHLRRYLSIYIIFLALIAGCLYAFWMDGKIYKQRFFQQIDAIKADTSYPIDVLEYKQGWFHSYAKVFISFPSPSSTEKNDIGVVIEQTITHGPWVYDSIQNKYTIAAAAIKSHIQITNDKNSSNKLGIFATMDSLAEFTNFYKNKIIIPVLDLESQGIHAKEIISYFSYKIHDDRLKQISFNLSVNSFTVKNAFVSFDIAGVQASSDMIYHTIGLWTGTQNVSLANLSITNNEQKYIISHAGYLSSFDVDQKNYYNYKVQQSLDQLILPEITISPIKMSYAITGINAQALSAFMTMSRKLAKMPDQQNIDNLSHTILNLISPDSMFNFTLSGETTYGEILITGIIDWPKDVALPTHFEDIQNHGRVHINCTVPVALVDYLITVYTQKTQPTIETIKPDIVTQPSYQTFEDQIEQLANNSTISTSTKTRLISLVEQHLSIEEFSTYLDQLVTLKTINQETADVLKNQYQLAKNAEDNPETVKSALTPEPPVPFIKERIMEYKNIGYIIEKNGNYLSSIVFENGQLKINDKLIPLDAGQP